MPKINPKKRSEILRAALKIARRPGGWGSITRAQVAGRAECAESLVSHYFGTMDSLRSQLMTIALNRGYVDLIAQAVPTGEIVLNGLSETLKNKVITYLFSR